MPDILEEFFSLGLFCSFENSSVVNTISMLLLYFTLSVAFSASISLSVSSSSSYGGMYVPSRTLLAASDISSVTNSDKRG